MNEEPESLSTTFLSTIAFGIIFIVGWYALWFILKG